MTKIDIIWCLFGITVCGFTASIFSKVNAIHSVQRNVRRYKPSDFVNDEGHPVQSYEELQRMF